MRPDLIVVGAGPGGAALSLLAARSGARVLLIERTRVPRDKVCGEFVSAEGCEVLRRLGLLEELLASGAPRIADCRLTDRRGRPLDVSLPRLADGARSGVGLSRERLDLKLVEAAAAAGVDVRSSTQANDPEMDAAGRVTSLRLVSRGGTKAAGERVRATVVVAADGRRSNLGRQLAPGHGDPRKTAERSWFGIKTHVAPGGATDRVELHLFDGGYAGVAPVEGNRLNLCLLTRVDALRRCGGRPERLFRERVMGNRAVRESLGTAPETGRWHTIGPLRFNSRLPVAAGVFFVGDAAGTVDPFCGEGISNALCGAERATEHALRAAEAGGTTTAIARAYARDWRREFRRAAKRSRWLGSLLQRPVLADWTLSLLRGPARPWVPGLVAATRTGRAR